ncbi:MAG: endonuclease/exonuclease/phosphatase family protein, partial [Salaquimonas sp.]|nr:endonuclease/exonuclease/phosphatase family protein [Salaquimonas sp.]
MFLLRTALFLAMLGLAAGIAVGFFGFVHPFFDTIANFRLHFSVGLLVLAALWSFRCSKAPSIVFALIGFGGLFTCASGLPLTSYSNVPSGGERVYRLFAMNLLYNNRTPGRVVDAIRQTDPDILYLTEVSEYWLDDIAALRKRFPHFFHCAEWETIGGSVILSRLPIDRSNFYCGDYASLGQVTIEIEGRKVAAGVVHLRWPWPASGPRQINELEPRLKQIGPDALLAGDFNSATWTWAVRRFAKAGDLNLVKGIGPTWGPTLGPDNQTIYWPSRLGLPIDNVMTKGAIRIVSVRRLPRLGSDHLPLLIEFVVRK